MSHVLLPKFVAADDQRRTGVSDTDGLIEEPLSCQFASMARRLAAFSIDFLVYTTLQGGIIVFLLTWIESMQMLSEASLDVAITTVCVTIMWLYYALMECSLRQATPGKMALGIKVVDLRGERVGFLRASARFFAKLLSMVGFVGFFIIDFTEKKQGLHDMVAGALVIRHPRTSALRNCRGVPKRPR